MIKYSTEFIQYSTVFCFVSGLIFRASCVYNFFDQFVVAQVKI
jgi:hypothetical protein